CVKLLSSFLFLLPFSPSRLPLRQKFASQSTSLRSKCVWRPPAARHILGRFPRPAPVMSRRAASIRRSACKPCIGRKSTIIRLCRIRFSSAAATPYTALTKPARSAALPRMDASVFRRLMQPRCFPWCGPRARRSRSSARRRPACLSPAIAAIIIAITPATLTSIRPRLSPTRRSITTISRREYSERSCCDRIERTFLFDWIGNGALAEAVLHICIAAQLERDDQQVERHRHCIEHYDRGGADQH